MNKTIAITGATGLIGSNLVKLLNKDYNVLVLVRDIAKAKKLFQESVSYLKWDSNDKSFSLPENLCGIIHLAGVNVFDKRWSKSFKKKLYDSRIESTKNLNNAIQKLSNKPKVFITSSAIGIYGDQGNTIIVEGSPKGNDFLANLCKDWEEEASKLSDVLRTVQIRTGIVLDDSGGALKQMLIPFKLFIGGPLGSGKQWFSWIHIDDMLNIIKFLLENDELNGAFNLTSPHPVTMKELAKSIGKTLHRPSLFKIPSFILKLVLGERSTEILKSVRVLPNRLLENNYQFLFTNIDHALKNIL